MERHPAIATAVLCGATLLVVTAASADWKVERGDTLYGISRATDTTIEQLVRVNDLDDPDLIIAGTTLTVPDAGTQPAGDDGSGGDGSGGDGSGGGEGGASTPVAEPVSDDGAVRTTTVQAGDTVDVLADRLDVSREAFMAANGFTSEGQVLGGMRVRSHAPPPPGLERGPASHTVTVGDTLDDIADRYGMSWQDLAEVNDLEDPGMIVLGSELTIPGHGSGFTCPVADGPDFINDFGLPKPGDRWHEGIDLHAERGTKVLAPVSGEVEHVTGTRGGLQVHLYGDDGYRYWGTHMDSLGPTGRVEAGDVLGTVGDTGNARGGPTHLHFEVYANGESVNPYPALERAC